MYKINLSRFAFNDGDTATGSQAIKFELDLEKDDNYVVVCVNSLSEALNYSTETWYDFCSNGFSSSSTVAIDLEYSGEGVVRYNTPTFDFCRKRYDLTAINNVPMRITNTLLEETIEVNVCISSFEVTYVAEELIKFSFALKPNAKPTITDTYTPPTP